MYHFNFKKNLSEYFMVYITNSMQSDSGKHSVQPDTDLQGLQCQ